MLAAASLASAIAVLSLALLIRTSFILHKERRKVVASREEARIQAARFEAIVIGMPDGLLVLDADLRVVGWNQHFADFVGVPESMLRVGLPLTEILRAQAEAGEFGSVEIGTEVARRIALYGSWKPGGTVERRRPNGRVMELRRSPMASGGFVTLYTDVTNRVAAETQLRQAQKMEAIGHLTGGMAHDFNNLLVVIDGNLDLALQALARSDPIDTDRRVRLARGGAERAAHITKRLLAFARQQELAPRIVNLNKVVADISELIRHSVGTSVNLETVLAGEIWDVFIDTHQLENALLNLAINSKDAMPDDGKLTIETANVSLDSTFAAHNTEVVPGHYVMVAVRDSGLGMTAEQAERAFEPFFTTKGIGKGSGLGLAQVFGFTKQSGGHVKIYTELGAGTTINLYLPRHAAPEPLISETPSAEPDLPRAREHETVLVVEDDEDVLSYTIDALETLGYQAIGARDADKALVALDNHPDVDLLMTDVELPGLNGQELAEAVAVRRSDIPVIYTTGYTRNAIVHRQILDRSAKALTKPFSRQALAPLIRELLDGKSKTGAASSFRLDHNHLN